MNFQTAIDEVYVRKYGHVRTVIEDDILKEKTKNCDPDIMGSHRAYMVGSAYIKHYDYFISALEEINLDTVEMSDAERRKYKNMLEMEKISAEESMAIIEPFSDALYDYLAKT